MSDGKKKDINSILMKMKESENNTWVIRPGMHKLETIQQ